jgi:hypothetical protein
MGDAIKQLMKITIYLTNFLIFSKSTQIDVICSKFEVETLFGALHCHEDY